MLLEPVLNTDLQRVRERMLANEELHPEPDLQRYYTGFAARFGAQVLRRLDGADLLDRMHNHSNRDSLVYWLEFKNDEEMPAAFGSIAVGSALKFGTEEVRRSASEAPDVTSPCQNLAGDRPRRAGKSSAA